MVIVLPGIEGETINLGAGEEVRIGDLAEMIIRLVGRPARIEVEAERLRPVKSEVGRLLADNRLAREKLGWAPQVGLPEGLRLTVAWIREHLDHYQPGHYQI